MLDDLHRWCQACGNVEDWDECVLVISILYSTCEACFETWVEALLHEGA